MSHQSFLLLVLVLGSANAFRIHNKKSVGRRIAGVPVVNDVQSGVFGQEAARDWLLLLKKDVTQEQLDSFCADSNIECAPQGHVGEGGIPFVGVAGTEANLYDLIKSHEGLVDFVEPNSETELIPELPADLDEEYGTFAAASWGLDKIGVSSAQTKGRGVHVYVIDSGIRTTHSDFGGRAIPTLEYSGNGPRECHGNRFCAVDFIGHGTHCAGTVGGTKYGVAPQATIHAVKVVFGLLPRSMLNRLVGSIDWVVTQGQRPAVISMSMGAAQPDESSWEGALTTAIDTASAAGVTVVVAAGNASPAIDACRVAPAGVPSAITVGSTDNRNAKASYSNYGRCVNIYAPGSDIVSAGRRSDSASKTLSGTSMACPHVAGAAALLLESNPNMKPQQVLSTMLGKAKSNLISGLTSSDSNKLLWVGGGSGPSPNRIKIKKSQTHIDNRGTGLDIGEWKVDGGMKWNGIDLNPSFRLLFRLNSINNDEMNIDAHAHSRVDGDNLPDGGYPGIVLKQKTVKFGLWTKRTGYYYKGNLCTKTKGTCLSEVFVENGQRKLRMYGKVSGTSGWAISGNNASPA